MIEEAIMGSIASLTSEEFVTHLAKWTPFENIKPDDLKIAKGYLSTVSPQEYQTIKNKIYTLTIEEILEFIARANPDLFDTFDILIEKRVKPSPIDYLIFLCSRAGSFLIQNPPLTIP